MLAASNRSESSFAFAASPRNMPTPKIVCTVRSDGACPVLKKQGPFEVCEDMAWEQLLEVPVTGEPRVSERAVDIDEAGVSTAIDCKASWSGQELTAPGE